MTISSANVDVSKIDRRRVTMSISAWDNRLRLGRGLGSQDEMRLKNLQNVKIDFVQNAQGNNNV